MKRVLSLLLSLSLLLALLPACQPAAELPPSETAGDTQPTPTPVITSAPTPSPTPEPSTGMALVRDTMLNFCSDELAGLEGYSVTMFEDSADFPQMVEETYGIPAELVVDGFVIDGEGDFSFEIALLGMPDRDSAADSCEILRDTISARLDERFKVWNEETGMYFVEDAELYQYARTRTSSGWIGCETEDMPFTFFIRCQNLREAGDVLSRAISQYWSEQSQEEPQPKPQSVEIGDGVFFIDASTPEAMGEPDPGHPGRALYVQPGEEDMSLYDTSDILAAWAAGNPDGLSEDDRAIYDSAKDVLENILEEGMDGFSKEAAIYEWVIQSVEYDWTHTDVMQETPRDSYTPYGGLVNHMAVCLGYATTFQLLAELAGIECITVVGAAGAADHAWNQVRLNGEWYCVDVTWDWPFRDGSTNGREWRYFNVTSDYMARSNHQWDYDNVPEATAEDHGWPEK